MKQSRVQSEGGTKAGRVAAVLCARLTLLVSGKVERPLTAAVAIGAQPEELRHESLCRPRAARAEDVERTAKALQQIRELQADGRQNSALRRSAALLRRIERKYGCDHPLLAPVLFEHSRLETAAGNPQKAEALHLQVLWVIEGAYGAASAEAARALQTLSAFYLEQGGAAQAQNCIDILRRLEQQLELEAATTARTEAIAGKLDENQRRFQSAALRYCRAEAVLENCRSSLIEERLHLLRRAADCWEEAGCTAAARRILLRALRATRRDAYYPAHASVIYLQLSRLTARSGSYRQACRYGEKAQSAARLGHSAASPQRIRCLANLGALYNRTCDYDRAAAALEEALALSDSCATAPQLIADIYDLLFDVYQARGDSGKANTFLFLSRAARKVIAEEAQRLRA